MVKRKVVFRTDGSVNIGLGHIVRCCALADMLRGEFSIYFCIRNPSPEVIREVQQYSISVYAIDEGLSFAEEGNDWIKGLQGDEIVVLDGYHFDTDYQLSIKSRGCKLVCIDDIYAYHFVSDILINHAGGARAKDYSTEPYTKIFLGFKYALLREPFLAQPGAADNAGGADELLICFGGADQGNCTLSTLKRVIGLYKGKINCIIGSAYLHAAELENFISERGEGRISLYRNIIAMELAAVMKRSSIAICSPSTISIEYLSLGVGTLYLHVIADNQKKIFEFLVSESLAFPLESFISGGKGIPNRQLRDSLFDGLQRQRYSELFNNL